MWFQCGSSHLQTSKRFVTLGMTRKMEYKGILNTKKMFFTSSVLTKGAALCTGLLFCSPPSSVKYKSHRTKHSRLIHRRKNKWQKWRWRSRQKVKPNLAEARRAGRELSDFYRLVVIGVILVIRIYVMITIWAGWRSVRETGQERLNIWAANWIENVSISDRNCQKYYFPPHKPHMDVTVPHYRSIKL